MTIDQGMMLPPQPPPVIPAGQLLPQEPLTQAPQPPVAPEVPDVQPPLDPEYAGSEEERERAINTLMELYGKYRDHRERYIEPIWNATYCAYMGTPPSDNAPYGSFYHIAEIFRQVEVLKPQLAAQLLPPEYFKYVPERDEDFLKTQAATKLVHKFVSRFDLEPELLAWLDSVSLWGTSYLMYGWKRYRRTKRKIAKCIRKEDGKLKSAWQRETTEILEEGPSLRWVNHWQVFTDFRCPRLEDSPAVFLMERVTVEDLKTRVAEGELDEAAVKEAIEAGPGDTDGASDWNDRPADSPENGEADAHPNPDGLYTLMTAWTNDGHVYSIINEKFMVRAQVNEADRVPMLVLRNYPHPDQHYGLGEPFMLIWDQKLLDDAASMWIDANKFIYNPMFVVASAAKKKWEAVGFKPGGAFFPDNIEQIKPLTTMSGQPPGIEQTMNVLRRNMQLATGNTDEQMGVTKHRTAGGIRLLQDAAGMRINHKVRWHMPVFKRLYLELYDLLARFMDAEFPLRVAGKDGREFQKTYGPEAFEPNVDVKVELPNESEDPVGAQSRALQFYTQTVAGGDPRWKFRRCADVLVKAFEPSANPADFYADELEDAKAPMYENEVWRVSGTLPEVQPDENHELHIQSHAQELQLATQQPGAVPPEWLQMLNNHLERHMQIFERIQMQQGAMAAPTGADAGGSGSPFPASDGQAEANFANGMTGAAQQGEMTGAIQ